MQSGKPIPGIEKALRLWPKFSFGYLSHIRRVSLISTRNEAGCTRLDLTLVLDNWTTKHLFQLRLKCRGISDLVIRDTAIDGIEVVDVSNWQWEGVRWEVDALEHHEDDLHFRCWDLEIAWCRRIFLQNEK